MVAPFGSWRRDGALRRAAARGEPGHLGVAEAVDDVVVDQPGGLHERVADRRADEREAALPERLAERVRLRRERRDLLEASPRVLPRLAADEAPEESVEAAELRPQREVGAGIRDAPRDLEPIADDAGIGEERADLGRVVAGHLPGIEAVEGAPVGRALPENRDPGEAGLGALEAEELEEPAVVVERNAPLAVVVRAVERVGPGPAAAGAVVGAGAGERAMRVLLCSHSNGSRWAG